MLAAMLSAGADTDVAADPPSAAPQPVPAPSNGTVPPDVVLTPEALLTQSLLHSATSLLYSPESTPARGARMIALTHAVAQLNPKHPGLNALQARVFELQGDYARAAEAVHNQLEHDATSAALGLSYLALGQAARQTVAERIAFLKAASEDEVLPPYTRAEALAKIGDLHMQHGDHELAAQAYAAALALDDQLFAALFGQFALADRSDKIVHVTGLLGLLRASPVYTGGAIELGAILREQGLVRQTVYFYAYAWRLAVRDMETIDEGLAMQYFDAMLDAGQYRQAIEIMVPVMARMKAPGWEMYCQLMEAYAGVEDMHKLTETRGHLLRIMSDRELTEGRISSPELLRQMAWYFLITDAIIKEDRRPASIRDYALKAMEGLQGVQQEEDSLLKLVLAVAQAKEAGRQFLSRSISVDQFKEQIEDLTAMAKTDPYAAYFLAEQLFLASDRRDAREMVSPDKVLSDGMKIAPYGRPMRLMRQMAARHNVAAPRMTELARTLGDHAEKWIERHQPLVDMALLPERHLRVSIRPVVAKFEAYRPVEIEVRLQNTSKVDIPLGPAGLCNPIVTFRLLAEARGVRRDFDNLPSAVLPAPRVLKAGEDVVTTVRIDVGAFEEYLYRHPLDASSCIVGGMLDPVLRGRKIVSSLPTIYIDRAVFDIADILGASFDRARGDWPEQYRKTLQYTVKDFQTGDPDQRMHAARVTGALLTVANDAAARRMPPPRQLVAAVEAPTLLSMFRAILRDPGMVTRQEALVALQYCVVDGRIIALMEPAFKDADPLMRLRAVEVVGSARPPDFRRILERFVDDKDPMVSMVARAMLDQKSSSK